MDWICLCLKKLSVASCVMWDEEDEAERRSRRREARRESAEEGFMSPYEQRPSYYRSSDNFGSNITTSSVSSVVTKNTFIEVQDEAERLSLDRVRSSRSRSMPPQIEDLQIQMASFFLDQLAEMSTAAPVETPAPVQSAGRKNKKNKPVSDEEKKARLFVGGLSTETTSATLEQYFSQYGELTEAQVILDKRSKHSRGFGFVAFKDGHIPPDVLSDTHTIDGTEIGVRMYGS